MNNVSEVSQQSTGTDCHTDTTVTTNDGDEPADTRILHSQSTIEASCHCPVFAEFGCIPEIIDVTEEYVLIRTFLSDRSHLTELVEVLKSTVEQLSLRRLLRVDATGNSDIRTLDLSSLTETQRQTAMKAVEAGYYERPRETSIGELAAEMDISESARRSACRTFSYPRFLKTSSTTSSNSNPERLSKTAMGSSFFVSKWSGKGVWTVVSALGPGNVEYV